MNLNQRSFGWSSFLWGILLFIPISIRLAELGGKPIDIVLSDLFPLFFLVIAVLYRKNSFSSYSIYLPIFAIAYYLGIALFTSILDGGSLSQIASSIRLSKQFLLIPCGAVFFHVWGWAGLRYFSYSILIILTSILLKDVLADGFPRGCGYQSRWGGCTPFGEVYGFPNSSASYLVLLSLSLFIFYKLSILSKSFLLWGIFCCAVLSLFSLSRSSWVFLFLGLLFFYLFTANSYKKTITSIFTVISLLVLSFLGAFSFTEMPIFKGVINKVTYYADGNEITSGRTQIWYDTLELIYEKPIFGYGFDYFSNYISGFDTAHQQYLELLFKSGMVGILIYFFCIYLFFYTVKKISTAYALNIHKLVLWVVLVPLLINGLFQPIFSYSLVGNTFMFFFGFILEANKRLQNKNCFRDIQ